MKKEKQDGPNIWNVQLEGVTVIVKGYADPLCMFKCSGGFGCDPKSLGRAIFGKFLSDGEEARIERCQIVRVANEEDMLRAAAWEAMSPKEKWKADLKCKEDQVQSDFDELNSLSRKSKTGPKKERLLDSYNLLWRRYQELRWLVECNLDAIAEERIKAKEGK